MALWYIIFYIISENRIKKIHVGGPLIDSACPHDTGQQWPQRRRIYIIVALNESSNTCPRAIHAVKDRYSMKVVLVN